MTITSHTTTAPLPSDYHHASGSHELPLGICRSKGYIFDCTHSWQCPGMIRGGPQSCQSHAVHGPEVALVICPHSAVMEAEPQQVLPVRHTGSSTWKPRTVGPLSPTVALMWLTEAQDTRTCPGCSVAGISSPCLAARGQGWEDGCKLQSVSKGDTRGRQGTGQEGGQKRASLHD